jgi:hypothetical protein
METKKCSKPTTGLICINDTPWDVWYVWALHVLRPSLTIPKVWFSYGLPMLLPWFTYSLAILNHNRKFWELPSGHCTWPWKTAHLYMIYLFEMVMFHSLDNYQMVTIITHHITVYIMYRWCTRQAFIDHHCSWFVIINLVNLYFSYSLPKHSPKLRG